MRRSFRLVAELQLCRSGPLEEYGKISSTETPEYAAVLETVRRWSQDMQKEPFHDVTSGLCRPVESAARRGRPAKELIGLGAGPGTPPDDDEVRRCLDEMRTR